jgi:hypothetical protein
MLTLPRCDSFYNCPTAPRIIIFLAINKFSAKVFLGSADKSYINGAMVGAQSGDTTNADFAKL